MAYELCINIALDSSQTGLTMSAQLINADGTNNGGAVTTGFTEIGVGNYLWDYASFPNGFRGGVKFTAAAVVRAFVSINPEEAENVNVKSSTLYPIDVAYPKNYGDYLALGTVDFKFTSLSGGTPLAITNGTVNIYRANNTTESASGITFTPNFDGRPGLNHVHIETGANTVFYTKGNDYQVILVVGQLSGINVANCELGSFSIENRSTSPINAKTDQLTFSLAGNVDANLQSIDEQTTNGNNATLKLKQLDIRNSAADHAVIIKATNVTSGDGVNISTSAGNALALSGFNAGLQITSSANNQPALEIEAQGSRSDAVYLIADNGGVSINAFSGILPNDNILLNVTKIENAIWDAARANHGSASTFGQYTLARVVGYDTIGTPLQATVMNRTLDVTATGEAGVDWANIGAPTTTINLSGTTIKTATDILADTDDIQTRLPAALIGGRMDSIVNAWGSGTPLMPTIFGRTLDVTPTGEAGFDWANIGAPTTTVNLSGTTIKTATDVETETVNIQSRLPAALTGNRMDSQVNAWGSGTPLMPTIQSRTVDITATGEAGIDWNNIGAPTTTQNLSGTSTKAVEPTVAGRTLDITTTGEAGVDWSNIGAPTTTQNLSGTTVKAVTDAVIAGTVNDKTGYALSAAGLDVVAAPADIANDTAARGSFIGMFRALVNRFLNKVDQTATTQRIYKDDSTTVALSQTVSDDNTTQIKGRSS